MEYSSRFVLVSAAATTAAAASAAYRVHYSCEITYFSIVGRRRMAFGIVVATAAMQSWLLSVAAVVFKIGYQVV